MRRSRLYLSLSIASLLVAAAIGVAHDRCRHARVCSAETVAEQRSPAHTAVWEAFDARDFSAMGEQATILADSGERLEGMRLRAYALRGQRRYAEAETAYSETFALASNEMPGGADKRRSNHKRWRMLLVQCETMIGRAICRHHLRDDAGSEQDIRAALEKSGKLVREYNTQHDHYMMACAYAVQSEMQTGILAQATQLKAIGALQRAIESGFNDWTHLRADLDVDALRQCPGFLELLPKP